MAALSLPTCIFLVSSYVGVAQTGFRGTYPHCSEKNKKPAGVAPITADVREFIKHPDLVRHRTIIYNPNKSIGTFARSKPHAFGEMVEEVQAGSQAWRSGVQKGWIMTEINGERVKDNTTLQRNIVKSLSSKKPVWVKYDVRAAVDCLHAACNSSDRFPSKQARTCAIACERNHQCQYWSWNWDHPSAVFQMCFLHGGATGTSGVTSVDAKGFHYAQRDCVYSPKMNAATSWPRCIMQDADLRHGNPVYTDVRPFISQYRNVNRHKDLIFTSGGILGMGFKEQPHDLGELVSEVLPGSQAANLGVRPGWIVRKVNGKSFLETEKLKDVTKDFENEKHDLATITVQFDVQSHLDCTNGDCTKSDKFPGTTAGQCADACFQVAECAMWFFDFDAEDKMCHFRSDYAGLRAADSSLAGSRDCSPAAIYNHFWLVMIFAAVAAVLLCHRCLKWRAGGGDLKTNKLMD